MHYFIDGYNLLFRIIDAHDDLQKYRNALLSELSQKVDFLNLSVTIVFDAAFATGDVTRTRSKHIEIIFTATGQSADSFILNELKDIETSQAKHHTVITSDKLLAWRVRRSGALSLDIESFLRWLNSRYRNKIKRKNTKKEDILERHQTTVRVAPANKDEAPGPSKDPDECFAYYQEVFEKNSPKLEESLSKEPPMSEQERWLRLFTDRFNNL